MAIESTPETLRSGRFSPTAPPPAGLRVPGGPRGNTVTASQARAARRRAARRDEQAVAAWLRELSVPRR